jgi:hypothetical protein
MWEQGSVQGFIVFKHNLCDMLNNPNIKLSNYGGQAFDSGSNLKGNNNGTQADIILENPHAQYIPCCAHSI